MACLTMWRMRSPAVGQRAASILGVAHHNSIKVSILSLQHCFSADRTSVSEQLLSIHMFLCGYNGQFRATDGCLAMSWQVCQQRLTPWMACHMAMLSHSQTAAPWA